MMTFFNENNWQLPLSIKTFVSYKTFTPLGVVVLSTKIVEYNQVMGAIALTVSTIFAIWRLYVSVKEYQHEAKKFYENEKIEKK